MNQKRRSDLEKNIMASLRKYRLLEEIRIIEGEKANVQEEPATPKAKGGLKETIKRFFKDDVVEIKNKVFGDDLPKAKKNLEDFEAGLPVGVSTAYLDNLDNFKRVLDAYFDHDDGAARLSMALELGMDEFHQETFHFLRKEESRESLSEFLLGDKKKLGEMLSFFSTSYKQIGAPKVNTFSKGFLLGLTAGSLAMLGVPLLGRAFGVRASKMSSRLFTLGGAATIGASELLLFSTLVGGGYIGRKGYRKKSSKKIKGLAKVSMDSEIAYSLSTALTLWEFNYSDHASPKAKESLDVCIKMIDDIRSDAEYLSLVEGENVEQNLKKITVCDNAITAIGRLTSVADPEAIKAQNAAKPA